MTQHMQPQWEKDGLHSRLYAIEVPLLRSYAHTMKMLHEANCFLQEFR
ncbi:hypothetical protein PROFUN_07151 [Planoprotostelium fungivorum]|uniref:Uncharacterized protein n=1 Tax=Planoprotostelium fungivorum TaxID=1890364 RepID=A0A2P6NML0_9EUKA|nr:hypothetical protein PROFUN_07151 [Planoprotostelium fungivorum]